MKAFFFLNHVYLSETQYGVQALHATSRMFLKYALYQPQVQEAKDILHTWAKDYETVVFLQGGYQKHLQEIFAFLDQNDHPYPYVSFCESEEALNGAMTCVGIIADERLLAGREEMRKVMKLPRTDFGRQTFERTNSLVVQYGEADFKDETYTDFEVELMKLLDRAKTA